MVSTWPQFYGLFGLCAEKQKQLWLHALPSKSSSQDQRHFADVEGDFVGAEAGQGEGRVIAEELLACQGA